MTGTLIGGISFDSYQTAPVSSPPDNTDEIMTDVQIGVTAVFGVGMAVVGGVEIGTALVIGTILEAPFCLYNLIKIKEEGGGFLQGTFSLAESAFGICLGAKWTGVGGAVASPVFSSLVNSAAEDYLFNDANGLSSTMNKINSTTLSVYDDGNLTINTKITDPNDLQSLAQPFLTQLEGSMGVNISDITINVNQEDGSTETYTVQSGDSPYSILSKYGMSQTPENLDKFLEANPDIVNEGRVSADKSFILLKKQVCRLGQNLTQQFVL